MKKRIIITAPAHPWLMETLLAKEYEVLYKPDITYTELAGQMSGIQGLVITTRIKVDKALIDLSPELEWIGRLGSGMELVDKAYAEARGICCASSPEGNRNAVAEHSLGMILSLLNHLPRAQKEMAMYKWKRAENRGTELSGKTVGIIGFGNTGQALARLLSGFGTCILYHDIKSIIHPFSYACPAGMEEICRRAQIISLHLPLTPVTRHLANEAFFSSLAQKPLFVSACRGEVTDTGALMSALSSGKVSGAALDVLEYENPDTFPEDFRTKVAWLTAQDNVIITPHIAGYTEESFLRMAEVLVNKLAL